MRITISTHLRARWNAWRIRTGSIFNF